MNMKKIAAEAQHLHMKDTIDKLMGDFQKFIKENPHFTNKSVTVLLNLSFTNKHLVAMMQLA